MSITPDDRPPLAQADADTGRILAEQFVVTLDDLRALATDPFEAAADAVITGDLATLRAMLAADPRLIHARSSRTHHATLLHHVGANGVEAQRQRTPPNAIDVATVLLDAGADVEATCDLYGGRSRTLGLVATSIHPHRAGLQLALIDLLLARGARLDDRIVNDCLANGRGEAAVHLASRGAALDLEGAAGIGRLDLVEQLYDRGADVTRPFAWACEYGRTAVVAFFLDRGLDLATPVPNHGQAGLHWAAHGGHVDTVRLLLARGASVDARDPTFDGTAADWARHGAGEASPDRRACFSAVLAILDGGRTEPSG